MIQQFKSFDSFSDLEGTDSDLETRLTAAKENIQGNCSEIVYHDLESKLPEYCTTCLCSFL